MQRQGKRHWFFFVLSICLLCLWIVGCTKVNQNPVALTPETMSVSPALTPVASSTSISLPTITSTSSPVPPMLPPTTMSSQEAEDALQELLTTNGNCTGKCLAGIRPDEMTAQEAIDQMARWGNLRMTNDQHGRTFINNLYLDPGSQQVNVNLAIILRKKTEPTYGVSFYIPRHEDGEFLGADVWLANRASWRAFQFDHLLKAYGIPSFVGFVMESRDESSIAYTVEIQYEKMNLSWGIGGLAHRNGQDVFICPSKDPHNLGIDINPERPLNEVQQFYPITWQALTSSDLQTFYQTFIDEGSSDKCVTTTLEQIMELDPYFR
jgi:hypothetical protein